MKIPSDVVEVDLTQGINIWDDIKEELGMTQTVEWEFWLEYQEKDKDEWHTLSLLQAKNLDDAIVEFNNKIVKMAKPHNLTFRLIKKCIISITEAVAWDNNEKMIDVHSL